jgi:hypothetical protein
VPGSARVSLPGGGWFRHRTVRHLASGSTVSTPGNRTARHNQAVIHSLLLLLGETVCQRRKRSYAPCHSSHPPCSRQVPGLCPATGCPAREDSPAAVAGAVTRVRDGGVRLAAGAGERRGGSRPRRAPPSAEAAGYTAAPAARLPRHPGRLQWEPLARPTLPLVVPRLCTEPGQGRTARRAEGVPLKTLEIFITGARRCPVAPSAPSALCRVRLDMGRPSRPVSPRQPSTGPNVRHWGRIGVSHRATRASGNTDNIG